MTEKQRRICRLCFTALNEELTNFSSLQTNMLQIVIPTLNLHSCVSPAMCRDCIKILEEAFAFKSLFLEIEDNLHTYTNDGQNKIELERILGISEVENYEVKDKKVCRICLELLENGSFVELTDDKKTIDKNPLTEVLQKCLPEIDIELTKDPVLCPNCITKLEKTSNFITRCITNEQKIANYLKDYNHEEMDLYNVVQYVQSRGEGKTVSTDVTEMEVEITDENGVESVANITEKTEGNGESAVNMPVVNEEPTKSSKKSGICIISNHVLTNRYPLALPTHNNQSNNKELGNTMYIPTEIQNVVENPNSECTQKENSTVNLSKEQVLSRDEVVTLTVESLYNTTEIQNAVENPNSECTQKENSTVDLSKEQVLSRDEVVTLTVESLYNTDSGKDPNGWIMNKENTQAWEQQIKRARMENSGKEIQNSVPISNSASARKRYNTRPKNSVVDLTKDDELLSDDSLNNNSKEDSEWDCQSISSEDSDEWDGENNQLLSRRSKGTMKAPIKRPSALRKCDLYCHYCNFKTQEEAAMNLHKFNCRINPYFYYRQQLPIAQGVRVITNTKPNAGRAYQPPVVEKKRKVNSNMRMFQVIKTNESVPAVVEKEKIVNWDKRESAVTKTQESAPAIYKNVEVVSLKSILRYKLLTKNKGELSSPLIEKEMEKVTETATKRKRPLMEESTAVLQKPLLQDEVSIFKCAQCGYNTRLTERIEQHITTHIHDITNGIRSYNKVFYCVKCLRPFYNRFSLQCHQANCANKNKTDTDVVRIGKVIYCTLCLFESDNEVLALNHIENCKKICVANVGDVQIL